MMRRLKIFITASMMVMVGSGLLSLLPLQTPTATAACAEKTFLGIKPWYHGLDCQNGSPVINDITTDPWLIVLNIVSIGIVLAGYVAVGLVMWGGIKYMIAGGESGKLSAAKTTIRNALIGLLLALSANAIVTFIGDQLGK